MRLLGLVLILAFTGVANAVGESKTVELKNAKGESVGSLTLTPLLKGVKVMGDLHGLTPGEHAIHFHEKSSCVAPKFESAGGHFAPAHNKHGFDMEGGPHPGDMANFVAAADGTAHVDTIDSNVTMDKTKNSITKEGSSIVVHEKADDYKSQPAGDAGGRFACGEIK